MTTETPRMPPDPAAVVRWRREVTREIADLCEVADRLGDTRAVVLLRRVAELQRRLAEADAAAVAEGT